MNHTKEPWKVVNGVDVQSGRQGCLAYVSTAGARGRTLDEAEANARRIVSAVNFCAGTATEYLDGAGNLGRMLTTAGAGVNAELLAACEAALALVEELEPEVLDGRDDVPELLRAVCARARGETPPA
jgi:hypothetical protein